MGLRHIEDKRTPYAMSQFKTRFESRRQDWETPNSIFDPLNTEFSFTLDVCATEDTAKCQSFLTAEEDALNRDWGTHVCWMNPPFREQKKWVKKAYEASCSGATVVCLVPSRTNTNWWHDYCMRGEVRFIRGRPKFGNADHGTPLPLAIVVFRPKGNYRLFETETDNT